MILINIPLLKQEVSKILKQSVAISLFRSNHSLGNLEAKQFVEIFLELSKKYSLETNVLKYEDLKKVIFNFSIVSKQCEISFCTKFMDWDFQDHDFDFFINKNKILENGNVKLLKNKSLELSSHF